MEKKARSHRRLKKRLLLNKIFELVFLSTILLSLSVLFILVYDVLQKGLGSLDWNFIISMPSSRPAKAGILPALLGTLWVIVLTALISIPVGIGTAIYLEEYANKRSWFFKLMNINIGNLAGVPSIVYGILGLTVFVQLLKIGPTILAGTLTLSLLILPVIIVASVEAIKAVPSSVKEGSYALGVSRWRTITGVILPMATPGMMTGSILALSRAMGEAAPLIMVGAVGFVTFLPNSILDRYTLLPMLIYNWTSRPQDAFAQIAAAGIIVMLILLLMTNLSAILLRHKTQNRVD
jgi:phosphate transport system permease protein